ncbi:MAG: cobalamin B12-binding domain-containing protein [Candidatus Delongbacteria bacterium]
MSSDNLVIGAALGQCVHLAGLDHFLRLCEEHGWRSELLGAAVPVETLLRRVQELRPALVAVSYRLTDQDIVPLLRALEEGAARLKGGERRWVLGGTPPVAAMARRFQLFERCFDGSEPLEELIAFIGGETTATAAERWPDTLLERVAACAPRPLLRHHYGEPALEATIVGAGRIAEARALDVLSLGPDQNAQEHFFRPTEMDPHQDGAGGVPVRRPEDLRRIHEATRVGNRPLLRCYSGTRDLQRWAEMSLETIHNAWGAIPLCWYSVMDGRSTVPFPEAILEKQSTMRFYAERGVPVEVNESHQWSLRDAHDALAVAMAFLAAYNAQRQGVRHYVAQLMHNTPPSTSPLMDLAKMLAKLDLIGELEGPAFQVLREVRAGITSLPADFNRAKGHLAASTTLAMALKPQILHVVGFTEARRVVDAEAVIESCSIARGSVDLCLKGLPDPARDPRVRARRRHLVAEARLILEAITRLGSDRADPWADAEVLTRAIRCGLLDAPHFRGNPHLKGTIVTACVKGGWEAVNPVTRRPLGERRRIAALAAGGQ